MTGCEVIHTETYCRGLETAQPYIPKTGTQHVVCYAPMDETSTVQRVVQDETSIVPVVARPPVHEPREDLRNRTSVGSETGQYSYPVSVSLVVKHDIRPVVNLVQVADLVPLIRRHLEVVEASHGKTRPSV